MLVLCNIVRTRDSMMALLMERSREVAFSMLDETCNFMHFMFQPETFFFVFILLLVNSTSSHPDFKMYLNACASAARIVFIYDKCFSIMTLNSSILFTEPEKCVNIHKAVHRVFVFGEKIFFESRKWSFLRSTAARSDSRERKWEVRKARNGF